MNQDTLRIGIGHDTHRLKLGGPLRIGGIDIDHSHSLEGHSDADVLLHAVTDAILGAAAMAWRAAAPDVWQQARAAHSADLRQRHGFLDTGPVDDASHEALLLRTRPPLVRGDFHMVT